MNDMLRAAAAVGAVGIAAPGGACVLPRAPSAAISATKPCSISCSGRPSGLLGFRAPDQRAGSGTQQSGVRLRPEVVTTGGSGFGIMTIIVAIERRWLSRQEALDRLLQMVCFLYTADSYHGILPHFLNGETGRTILYQEGRWRRPRRNLLLLAGLLCARQYFDRDDARERELRDRINAL